MSPSRPTVVRFAGPFAQKMTSLARMLRRGLCHLAFSCRRSGSAEVLKAFGAYAREREGRGGFLSSAVIRSRTPAYGHVWGSVSAVFMTT